MKPLTSLARQEQLFNRLVIGFVVIGFTALVGTGCFAIYVMQRNIAFTSLVAHTYDVRKALADVLIVNERLETARRGYLLSRESAFRRTYEQTAAAVPVVLDRVQRLTADNPRQQARMGTLRGLMAQQRVAAEESLHAAARGLQADFQFDYAAVKTRDIRRLAQVMADEEQRLLDLRNAARLANLDTLVKVVVAAGLLLIVVAIGSLWVIFRFTRDLTASRNQLQRLNDGLEDTVRDRTADLQRANDEIQRFAYIVSHDLRSPLVNVMGFTSELEAAIAPLADLLGRAEAEAPQIVTPDARAAVETDLPEAVGFIRTSTQKMDRLINAILRLSREGRRVLAPEPIAMEGLLAGVVANVRHHTEELGAVIQIEPPVPDIVSDRLALEQILSNLVENALKYLKPGRPGRIALRGRREGGRVIYEVADNGRGIDPRDHDRIFDLFRRSGVQDQPGEGIGLAHVRALTYRLGGVIDCQSMLDQGATFRVSLPSHLNAQGTAA